MSDRLTLTCTLDAYHPLNMVMYWEKFLRLFPYSKLSQASVVSRVHAVSWNEPIVFERAYPSSFDIEDVLETARDFHHEDSAFQLECFWDLVQFETDWQLRPAPVTLWCFGPAFENDLDDHLRVELGLEDRFLPRAGEAASVRASQANLMSLMHLVKDIEEKLPVVERHLISESGENFAKKLAAIVAGEGSWLH